MKEFKINLSKGEVLYTGSYICTLSKTTASTPEQISLEAAAEKLAEELIMQQAMNREHQRQQDVTVIQFRQAQEEISRLRGELKQAHEKSSNHLDEWRRAETQTAKISDELMNMKVLLRMEQGKVRQQKTKNEQMKEALTFYAKETNYTKEFEDCPPAVELDGGQTARKALEGAAE
ncbi:MULTISPECIES: hypothetical protein [Bacillus amyloliquefaciens group]|uniref:hypothetical protein n=1 Tax=Bacillus amyloliquefaciens group TaxID=1938374 RepID=UPI000B5699CE|nr:hypothetical protein S101267_02761 [Bacillus amyloliquefaciens]